MKAGTKLIILIILMVIGIALLIWGNVIMRNHEGYVEMFRAARNDALPQFISSIVVLVVAYVLTYGKSK